MKIIRLQPLKPYMISSCIRDGWFKLNPWSSCPTVVSANESAIQISVPQRSPQCGNFWNAKPVFLSVQRKQNHNYRNCILEQTVHDQCSLYIVVAFIRTLICINSDLIQVVCMMAPLACQNTIPLGVWNPNTSHPVTPSPPSDNF